MLLSIVIVEYRSVAEVNRCIGALAEGLTVPFEVIVSSNSMYGEGERLQILRDVEVASIHRSVSVRWIFNGRNGGFAYAMNRGLAVAKGDYLVIMNSDCILRSDLMPMIGFLQSHPDVGAIAPQLRDAAGNIQDTARPYVTPWRFVMRCVRRVVGNTVSVMESGMDYSRVQTVDWVIGAFIMVTRRAYELTRGLDEACFMYAEDVDWCTRIRQQGYEVVYFPRVQIEYKGTRRARSSWKYSKIFLQSHLHYWNKFGFIYGYPKRREMIYE